MAKLNDKKAQQRLVDKWNLQYAVGQAVTVRLDSGEVRTTVTRSKAELLSGHSAVVWLEGVSGCYLLSRVRPFTGEVAA